MYTSTVQESPEGLVLSVPADMKAELGLEAGATVEIELDASRLIVRPVRRRYSLQELLDQCDFSLPISEEDKQWDAMPPVGRELI